MFAIVAILVAFAIWWLTRVGEMFCISIRNGKVLVIRGRAPGVLVNAVAEIAAHSGIRKATIRGMRTENGGCLKFSGSLDEGLQQRMRNTFALYPASQLRQAPAIARPTLGQLSGIAWLAWLMDRR